MIKETHGYCKGLPDCGFHNNGQYCFACKKITLNVLDEKIHKWLGREMYSHFQTTIKPNGEKVPEYMWNLRPYSTSADAMLDLWAELRRRGYQIVVNDETMPQVDIYRPGVEHYLDGPFADTVPMALALAVEKLIDTKPFG